uniref:PCI domain-containing protein n=1 Tax=Arcella intermedia TaxID=1963864 RepID=A0A6B2L2J0_9EUKA
MRHIHRAVRHTFARIRRKLNVNLLTKLIQRTVPEDLPDYKDLLSVVSTVQAPTLMEVDTTEPSPDPSPAPKEDVRPTALSPEVEVYVKLLVVVFLVDHKQLSEAAKLVTYLVDKVGAQNSRTMDPLSAKVYFYFSRVYELSDHLADIRVKLLQLQRTATLRHNYEGQVVLLNLLLRNYLHYNLYDQAEKLASKTDLKTERANTNELARYNYYLGRIKAIQLSYTEANRHLQQALRKGPRETADGFRASVTKFLIVVQLLLGEIPERSIFRSKGISHALVPYLEVTQAVRRGDVGLFKKSLENFGELFKKDKTFALIQRLHHNVIKTGLKKINSSYSRIYFKDICKKLGLDSVQDAEFIVAKAIHDGIIEAKINHTEGYIKSNENIDIYSTNEPQRALSQRIQFCVQIHNDAVKAMRYPPDFKKIKDEKVEKAKEADPDTELPDLMDDDEDD